MDPWIHGVPWRSLRSPGELIATLLPVLFSSFPSLQICRHYHHRHHHHHQQCNSIIVNIVHIHNLQVEKHTADCLGHADCFQRGLKRWARKLRRRIALQSLQSRLVAVGGAISWRSCVAIKAIKEELNHTRWRTVRKDLSCRCFPSTLLHTPH